MVFPEPVTPMTTTIMGTRQKSRQRNACLGLLSSIWRSAGRYDSTVMLSGAGRCTGQCSRVVSFALSGERGSSRTRDDKPVENRTLSHLAQLRHSTLPPPTPRQRYCLRDRSRRRAGKRTGLAQRFPEPGFAQCSSLYSNIRPRPGWRPLCCCDRESSPCSSRSAITTSPLRSCR